MWSWNLQLWWIFNILTGRMKNTAAGMPAQTAGLWQLPCVKNNLSIITSDKFFFVLLPSYPVPKWAFLGEGVLLRAVLRAVEMDLFQGRRRWPGCLHAVWTCVLSPTWCWVHPSPSAEPALQWLLHLSIWGLPCSFSNEVGWKQWSTEGVWGEAGVPELVLLVGCMCASSNGKSFFGCIKCWSWASMSVLLGWVKQGRGCSLCTKTNPVSPGYAQGNKAHEDKWG